MSDILDNPPRGSILSRLPLGLLAVLAAAIVLASAAGGAGIIPDSVIYLQAAENLRQGQHLTVPTWQPDRPTAPLTHFPPLLPVLLAGLSWAGLEPVAAAILLNAACQAASVTLLALLVGRATGLRWLGLLAGTFLALSPRLMDVHVSVLSEPLFLALMLLCLYLLARYLHRPRRWLLVPLAAAAALSVLARYVGVVVVAAAGLALLAWDSRPWKRRLGDAVLFGLLAGLPLAGWLARNKLAGGSAANRQLAWHPIEPARITEALETMGRWLIARFLPPLAGVALVIALLLAALAATLLLRRRKGQAERERDASVEDRRGEGAASASASPGRDAAPTMGLLLLFCLLYGGFLLASISFVDALTPLDNRLLIPLLAPLVGLAACLVAAVRRLTGRPWLLLIGTLGLLGLAALQARQLSAELRGPRQAEGFASPGWTQSVIMRSLAATGEGRKLYSNWPDAIQYATGRPAYLLPGRLNPYSRLPNERFERDMERMERDLRAGAWLVLFDEPGRTYLADRDELRRRLDLRVLLRAPGGTVYAIPPGPAATRPARSAEGTGSQ